MIDCELASKAQEVYSKMPQNNPVDLPRLQLEFVLSAPNLRTCPPPLCPEIAISGRSNAGKSSVINRLTGNRQTAKVSKTPGRTRLINFFERPNGDRLVDLPGYGYAKAERQAQAEWQSAVNTYLTRRDSLVGLILVMDIRHPLQPYDLDLLRWAEGSNLPVHVLLSKADKLGNAVRSAALKKVKTALGRSRGVTVQTFSSLSGQGLPELLDRLDVLWQVNTLQSADPEESAVEPGAPKKGKRAGSGSGSGSNRMTDATAAENLSALERDASRLPLTHLPDWSAVTPESVEPGVNLLLDDIEVAFETLETGCAPTWPGLMEPLERLSLRLGRVIGTITHLLSVKYSDALQQAWDAVRPRYVTLTNRISQSTVTYQAMRTLRDGVEGKQLSAVRRRILDESIRGMERSGVHLTGIPRERFQAIQTRLAELTNGFSTNLVKAERTARVRFTRAEEVSGIPSALLDMAAKTARDDGIQSADVENGPWHFIVNGVNYAIVTYANNPASREAFYRAFRNRGQDSELDNRPLLSEILRLRQEQAQLVGFANFVELSLDAKMAKRPDAVWALMNRLENAARPAAQQELASLTTFARQQSSGTVAQLAPWDVPFFAEKLEQAKFGYDNEALRAWFQMPIVIEGLFGLTERLYGATFHPITDGSVPLWDPSVLFYEVRRSGRVIAGFFLDPCSRPGEKRGGAWMNIVVDRNRLQASSGAAASLPVALMVMNARPPADGKPALMSLDEVRTLFHEFGHATQLLFTEVDEGGASGLNLVEWDAVELASQFNEYWMDYKPFLRGLSRHVDTGEPLDEGVADRVIEGANFMAGNATLRQLLFAKTDLRIHAEYGLPGSNEHTSPADIERAVAAKTLVLPTLEGESQLPAFTHLFSGGYAAGYYSYKWAEVLAADAFGAFNEVGLDNEEAVRSIAIRFRDTVLALGGSLPADEVYRRFRGRDAAPDALLQKQGLIPAMAVVG